MNTPRTDEEYAKTLNSLYEYVGAEYEAWHWARKLERELAELEGRIKKLERELAKLKAQ